MIFFFLSSWPSHLFQNKNYYLEEDKLENRTDGSDAFDTVCIGVENFPVRTLASAGGVISIGGR